MVQAGRSRVRFPMRLLEYQEFSWCVKSGRSVRITPHRHMSADCLKKCGNLDVSQPYGPPQPVTGIALRFTFYLFLNLCNETRRVKGGEVVNVLN
jgi:hypothetical protein